MKETGIIMSGNHPRLILDGRKTQTRRVVKLPAATNHLGDWEPTYLGGDGTTRDSRGVLVPRIEGIWHTRTGKFIACPYGQVGDRLWVRETHLITGGRGSEYLAYKADGYELATGLFPEKWRPSIHMPRWASRITRDITLLRVEQLRDISEADAQAEGGYTIEEFIKLFIKINHLPEDANPWNWVIGW